VGFVANENRDVRSPDSIQHPCEKQNITEFQIHQCRVRAAMQSRHDDKSSTFASNRAWRLQQFEAAAEANRDEHWTSQSNMQIAERSNP
jgi:hypothetical protein